MEKTEHHKHPAKKIDRAKTVGIGGAVKAFGPGSFMEGLTESADRGETDYQGLE